MHNYRHETLTGGMASDPERSELASPAGQTLSIKCLSHELIFSMKLKQKTLYLVITLLSSSSCVLTSALSQNRLCQISRCGSSLILCSL